MAMDYGLLGGVGTALNSAVDAYKQERAYKDDLEMRRQKMALEQQQAEREQKRLAQQEDLMKQNLRLGLLKQGYEMGPEGNLQKIAGYKDPEHEQALAHAEYYRAMAKNAPIERDIANQLKREQLAQIQQKAQDEEFKKSPMGRLEKSPSDVRQKLGFITSGLKNVTDYENAYNEGGRQNYLNPSTPLIGGLMSSTPIDDARVNLEESIGRLASGGAISQGEEARFRKMIPTAADSDQAARRKLANLRSEMENKLTGYGFKTGDLANMGFDSGSLGYGNQGVAQNQRRQQAGGLIQSPTRASQAQEPMSPEDMQAIQWAKQNPKDPRAAQIMKLHGM